MVMWLIWVVLALFVIDLVALIVSVWTGYRSRRK